MGDQVRASAEVISRKHILIDTCVLISLVHHLPKGGEFFHFYQMLVQSDCALMTSPFIRYELLCRELSVPARQRKRELLHGFEAVEVPLPLEVYSWMLEFSWLYASQSLKEAGMVDFSNLAYLKKYQNNILLATINHRDYPTQIVDRVHVHTIDDCDNEILNIGFYRWNEEKYQALKGKVSHLLE